MAADIAGESLFQFVALRPAQKLQESQARLVLAYDEGTFPPFCKELIAFIGKGKEEPVPPQPPQPPDPPTPNSPAILVNQPVTAGEVEQKITLYTKSARYYLSPENTKQRELINAIRADLEKIASSPSDVATEEERNQSARTLPAPSDFGKMEDMAWDSWFLLCLLPKQRRVDREEVLSAIRTLNALKYYGWKIPKKRPNTPQEIKELLRAFPVLPAVLASVARQLSGAPADGPVVLPSQEAVQASRVKPIGFGDLKVVTQTLLRYQAGEIAHIENVMRSEYRERKHRHLLRNEVSTLLEVETVKEVEKDLQTEERYSLKQELANTLKADTQFKLGVKVSAKYGDFVQINTDTDYATNTSIERSDKTATDFSRDVMERTVSRITERVRQQTSRLTIEESEETNTHGFDNKLGQHDIVGVYRWVDKVYQAQVVNYGQRLMFQFMVPEPAYLYKYVRQRNQDASVSSITAPPPFEVPDKNNPGKMRPLQPDDLTEENYFEWLSKYDVKVDKVAVFPQQLRYVGASASTSPDNGKKIIVLEKSIKIPRGYKPIAAYFGGDGLGPTPPDKAWLSISVGSKFASNDQSIPWFNLSGEDFQGDAGDDSKSEVPVTVVMRDYYYAACNIIIKCERTENAIIEWKLNTYLMMRNAYETALAAYNDKLKQVKAEAAGTSSTSNSALNRDVENAELKRSCLTLMTGEHFDGNATITPAKQDPATGEAIYPEIDIDKVMARAPHIQFFEQAFEWEHMTYLFYPYYWGEKGGWPGAFGQGSEDPLFLQFLQSGAARVVVPVRPNYEDVVLYYLETGEIWMGGDAPVIGDPLYMSIAAETKAQTDTDGGTREGEPWEVKLPTSMVALQQGEGGLSVLEDRTYVTRSGDTLSAIASRFYGRPELWRKIYDANRELLAGEHGVPKRGETLLIPPK